jgi:hypothetical protein
MGPVQSFGHKVSQGSKVRAGYATLGQGLSNLAGVFEGMEKDRLEQQADEARHLFEIELVNKEAAEFSKQFYDADDPALLGLDVRRFEPTIGPGGDLVNQPRTHIPADEVWPELLSKTRDNLIAAHSQTIESETLRDDFIRYAELTKAQANLRLATKTAQLQYARGVEQRKWRAEQYRQMGRWDLFDDMVAGISDTGEKQELRDWGDITKEVDSNTDEIATAIANQDLDDALWILNDGYERYLGYISGDVAYTGKLDPAALESEAHRYRTHYNQVKSQSTADKTMFESQTLYNARMIGRNADKGTHLDTALEQQTREDLQLLLGADPDNKTLYNTLRDLNASVDANNAFRWVISDIREDETVFSAVARYREDLAAPDSTTSTRDRDVSHKIDAIITRFINDMNSDPIQTLANYGLATNPKAPIETVNFENQETLASRIAIREYTYGYYQGLYGYTGDIFTENERAQLDNLLADEAMPNDVKLSYIYSVAAGSDRYTNKIWGPSVSTPVAGKYAALGQLMIDYETIGLPNKGLAVARQVMNGLELFKRDPTVVEDYTDTRAQLRAYLGASYNQFPAVVDAYLDNITAYAVSTNTDRFLKNRTIKQAIDTVTGGVIEWGAGTFLAPAAGLTQENWDEWINEYDPSNFGTYVMGWSNKQVAEALRNEELTIQPTGASRNDFFLIENISGKPLYDRRNNRPYRFKYDPNAEKRYIKR